MDNAPTIRTAATHAYQPCFTSAEWMRLACFYGFVIILHLLGWSLYLYFSSGNPALVGLGLAAYLFGLRHAFDADHIAAIDDSVRYLIQGGKNPLGAGFFFSLGHSTIVFALAVAIVFSAATLTQSLPGLESAGSLVGAGISGAFPWLIGILNLLVLLDILRLWHGARRGKHGHTHVDELLAKRGLMNRLFGGRLARRIGHSWQMYPLGLLFGLGFDTATEIGLLAMTAAASATVLPWPAALSLPILFTAGMTAMDTTDGVLMCKVYNWAFVNPLRKVFYNLGTTGLAVAVALVIGTIELLQVLIGMLGLHGTVFDWIANLGLGALGYIIVALFLLAWAGAFALWKFGRIRERDGGEPAAHVHEHRHESGVTHTHRHFH